MDAVIVDPADIRKLVAQWRKTAKLMEQAAVCKFCPVGGAPTAMRECARDAEALLTEQNEKA